ncbi:hypothetical protein C3Y92_09605 [Solidesulfovibrio carbinolicus]|uniref:Mobilization protein n=2 Tax=Solidesulfovibrio carbinolicus TaxID=296842 RepID=A0A4P6HLL0_9BACT|nr:hypothetical protein C3Y92_09605 [Solidesulfovibrio carbinolicus]
MAQIEKDAEAYGKSVAGYIRDRLTGRRIQAKTDQQMLAELRRIGQGIIKHWRVNAPELADAIDRLADRINR